MIWIDAPRVFTLVVKLFVCDVIGLTNRETKAMALNRLSA
jgi:hypothetical protein